MKLTPIEKFIIAIICVVLTMMTIHLYLLFEVVNAFSAGAK